MKLAELFIRLTVDQKGLKGGLTDAERSLDRFGKRAGKVAGLVGAGLFAGIVKQTVDAQNELARLNAVLASTGGAAGKSVGELTGFADALQKVTTFSSGDTQRAMGRLLTYTALTGDMFDKATVATLDMASALGMDVAQAAEKVGNALQYPSVALGSLSKQGFRFTEEQKNLIKKFEATGQIAKAQAIILGELELAYGGSAKAARNTLGGALIALKNAFNDTLTASGESTKGIVGFINSIAEALPGAGVNIGNGLDIITDQFRRFKRDIMALNLGLVWADANLRFWDRGAARTLDLAKQEFWKAQNAIDPLTLPGVFVDAPKGSGGKGGGGGLGGDADAAKKAWDNLLGTMRDTLSLQGAMKEAGMNTLSVDQQIFAAYQRINDEIARGVRLTNEQKAAAISLKTALGAAMAPMPGGVGMTQMAGGNPTAGIKVKGSNLFDTKDQYGNRVGGMFKLPTAAEMEKARKAADGKGFFGGMAAGFRPKDSTETVSASLGEEIGQMINQASGGMAQAFASFGPMAAILPVINSALESLAPVFESLMAPLRAIGQIVGEVLAPPLKLVADLIGVVLYPVLKLLSAAARVLVVAFSYLQEGLGYVVKGLGKLIDSLPFVSAKGIIRMGQDMIDAARAARKNTDATDKATEAVEKFASSLSNIPRVLNVNALRHMVTGGGGTGPKHLPPDRPLFTGPVNININGAQDPRRVAEEVGRALELTNTRGGMSRLQVAFG